MRSKSPLKGCGMNQNAETGGIKTKTEALSLLDEMGIRYSVIRYKHEDDHSAIRLSELIGTDPEITFKTLVLKGDKSGYFVCVVPGHATMDMKKVLRLTGNRKCSMLRSERITEVTGYVQGGCSPLCMRQPYPTYLDQSAAGHPDIVVSAGELGCVIRIAAGDLIAGCGPEARMADIIA